MKSSINPSKAQNEASRQYHAGVSSAAGKQAAVAVNEAHVLGPFAGHLCGVDPKGRLDLLLGQGLALLEQVAPQYVKLTRAFANRIQPLNLLAAASKASQSQMRQFPESDRVSINPTDLLPNRKKKDNF